MPLKCLNQTKKTNCPFFNKQCNGSIEERLNCFRPNTLIYYIIDFDNKQILFFHNYDDAKAKELEFGFRDVKLENEVQKTFYQKNEIKIPRFSVQLKTLKSFYGTVWVAESWSDLSVSHKIEGRMKDLKAYENDPNYKIRKIVLIPYAEYTSYYNRKEEIEKQAISEETKKTIDNTDFTKMFEHKTKRRSPF